MTKSETITTIAAALAKAHASIGAAYKGAENPFFKSRYADLGSVMAVCKEPLSANGISVMQLVSSDDNGTILDTMLLHSSGEFISTQMKVIPTKPNDLQALGSAITYCRRYALQAMLSIPSVDDDAEWAAAAARNKPETPAETKAAILERGGTVEEFTPEPEKVPPTAPDWKEVVCHIGKAKGPMLGKKLGEMPSEVRKWLVEKWLPKRGTTKKDVLLAAAVMAIPPDSLAEASETPEAQSAAPEPQNEPETAKNRKATAEKPAAEAEKIDWRSVKALPVCGPKIAEAPLGELGNPLLRAIVKQILPKLPEDAKRTIVERIFANAIAAAVEEMKPFDDPKWFASLDADGLRGELQRRLLEMDISSADADKQLTEGGVFTKGETIATAPAEILTYLLTSWPAVSATLKGGE